jgi:hypothetical protein
MSEKTMDEAEARQILENLARHGPPTAQVAAIKVLREMHKADAEAEKEAEPTAFDRLGLYDVEVGPGPAQSKARPKDAA